MEYTGFILPNCHIPCKRCHKLKISFFYTYKSFLADLNVQYINFSLSLFIISPQCSLSFIVVKDLYLTCITLLSVSFSLHSCIHVLYEQIKNVVVDVSWEDMTRKKDSLQYRILSFAMLPQRSYIKTSLVTFLSNQIPLKMEQTLEDTNPERNKDD